MHFRRFAPFNDIYKTSGGFKCFIYGLKNLVVCISVFHARTFDIAPSRNKSLDHNSSIEYFHNNYVNSSKDFVVVAVQADNTSVLDDFPGDLFTGEFITIVKESNSLVLK